MTHWLWWQDNPESVKVPNLPPLTTLKDVLALELDSYFNWMKTTMLFHGVPAEKVQSWATMSKQYLSSG